MRQIREMMLAAIEAAMMAEAGLTEQRAARAAFRAAPGLRG